jgi:hypothetical protein
VSVCLNATALDNSPRFGNGIRQYLTPFLSMRAFHEIRPKPFCSLIIRSGTEQALLCLLSTEQKGSRAALKFCAYLGLGPTTLPLLFHQPGDVLFVDDESACVDTAREP